MYFQTFWFRYPSLFFAPPLVLCVLFWRAKVLSTEISIFEGKVEINLLLDSILVLKWYAEKEGGKGNDLYINCILSCFIFLSASQSLETWGA